MSAMHTVVRAILNAQRQGTQSARTRTEVRGGGRKIYRQKGTGNARHHGRRAPQFTHGGVVFAPKPRSYRINVPKAIRRLAMKSALSCKVTDDEMIVLDKIELAQPKTKLVAPDAQGPRLREEGPDRHRERRPGRGARRRQHPRRQGRLTSAA